MLKSNDQFKNKTYLVYGYGKTGSATYKYLKKNNKVFIFDDNKNFISIKKLKLINFDFIVLSPGIDIKKCKLKNFLKLYKKKIITDLDLLYIKYPKNLKITVTGTNGKSTTAKLLFEILKDQKRDVVLSGNIGIPVLSIKNIKQNTIFVIEASSYQIDYSQFFRTDFSFILNISPDHLDRHGSIQKYTHAKFKLVINQNKKYKSIIEDNKYLNKEIKKFNLKSKIIKINDHFKDKKKLITNNYFKNINNLKNLSFIFEFSKIYKLNQYKLIKTINSFKGLNYRQQIIYQDKNILIINDSKSTSFSSSLNLLMSYKNIYWIVGGLSKKGDKFNLHPKYFNNIQGYIFGKDQKIFYKILRNKIKSYRFKNLKILLENIIKKIKKSKKSSSCVLFSPAAASFDNFKNFEDRGRYFNSLIKTKNFIKRIYA